MLYGTGSISTGVPLKLVMRGGGGGSNIDENMTCNKQGEGVLTAWLLLYPWLMMLNCWSTRAMAPSFLSASSAIDSRRRAPLNLDSCAEQAITSVQSKLYVMRRACYFSCAAQTICPAQIKLLVLRKASYLSCAEQASFVLRRASYLSCGDGILEWHF